MRTLFFSMLILFTMTASASQEIHEYPAFRNGSYVDIRGVVRTNTPAFGGGFTSVIVETEDRNWELEFGADVKFKDFAKTLDGKSVVATGRASVREGAESGPEYFLEVTHLRPTRAIGLRRSPHLPEYVDQQPENVAYESGTSATASAPAEAVEPPMEAFADESEGEVVVEAEPLGRPIVEDFFGREPPRQTVPRGSMSDYLMETPMSWYDRKNALQYPFRDGDDRRGVITPKFHLNW